jgi:uncharacterized protein YcnI
MLTTGVPGACARRIRYRCATTLVVAAVSLLASPLAAWGHVTIQPDEVEGGGFAVVTFRVPTEREDASTTLVRISLPDDEPIGSVLTKRVPGWKVTTEKRVLAEPIDMFGEQVDSVVSEITWTATGEGTTPGQYEDFDLSLGPLPKGGEMVFNVTQTYSGGETVKWNQVSIDDSIEPEHPAPVLRITTPGPSGAEQPEDGGDAATPRTVSTVADDSDHGGWTAVLALAVSGLALLMSLGALVRAGR